MVRQPTWQRIIVLTVLGYEGLGALLGGGLLAAAPDGRLMNMPVEIMRGFFPDYFIPGLMHPRVADYHVTRTSLDIGSSAGPYRLIA